MFPPPQLLRQTGQILHSQLSAFLCTHIKSSATKSNLPIYASNWKCNHWSTCETSVYYQLSKVGKSCILYSSPGYIVEYTCSAFIWLVCEGAKISLRKCPIWTWFSQQLSWDSGIKISTSCSIKEINEELKMTFSLFCASCFSLGKSHLLHWGGPNTLSDDKHCNIFSLKSYKRLNMVWVLSWVEKRGQCAIKQINVHVIQFILSTFFSACALKLGVVQPNGKKALETFN